MLTADQAYGPVPVVAPQTSAATAQPVATSKAKRPGPAESATMTGDPVLVWVVLVGLAVGLGWLNVRVDIG